MAAACALAIPEISRLIITSIPSDDKAALWKAMLVSKVWHGIAIKILWDSVAFTCLKDLPQPRRQNYAQHIRHLLLNTPNESDGMRSISFPQLRILDVLCKDRKGATFDLEFIDMTKLEGLKVEFGGWSGPPSLFDSFMKNVYAGCVNIKRLEISLYEDEDLFTEFLEFVAGAKSLVELRICAPQFRHEQQIRSLFSRGHWRRIRLECLPIQWEAISNDENALPARRSPIEAVDLPFTSTASTLEYFQTVAASLRELKVSLDGEVSHALKQIALFGHLQYLTLSCCGFTSMELKDIIPLTKLQDLQQLTLHLNAWNWECIQISKAELDYFVSQFSNLSSLTIFGYPDFDDASIANISQNCPHLVHLALDGLFSFSQVREAEMCLFSQLETMFLRIDGGIMASCADLYGIGKPRPRRINSWNFLDKVSPKLQRAYFSNGAAGYVCSATKQSNSWHVQTKAYEMDFRRNEEDEVAPVRYTLFDLIPDVRNDDNRNCTR